MEEQAEELVRLAYKVAGCIRAGGKLLICGNGGSAADSQHLAAEFVNRFSRTRPALPALALTTDTSVLTSIGNDGSFEEIFARQVQALGRKGDVLLLISTSGESPNLLAAAEAARHGGLFTTALLGREGGRLAPLVDLPLVVPSQATPRVQEIHILAGHILCHLVEEILFGNDTAGEAIP